MREQRPKKGLAIEGLVKGLQVLEAMAAQGGGSALEIARRTGIPRPTVHRVLHTLIREGYVHQPGRGKDYRLTKMVTLVAEGFRGADWLYEASGPLLQRMRSKVVWPMDTAVCEGQWMVICANSHDLNPLSLDRVYRGRKVDMVASALGRAYLAFAPAAESEILVDALTADLAEPHRTIEIRKIHQEMQRTRERGYALRVRELQPKTSSIAVPVMHQESVIACVNIHWIDRAVRLDEAIANYLPHLREVAHELEEAYARHIARSSSAS